MVYDPYVEARARLTPNVEPTVRSAKPKVIGILAIIFASFGLLSAAVPLGMEDEMRRHHVTWSSLGAYGTWLGIWVVRSLVISGLHLAGGIQAVRYRSSGPRLLTIYGVLALVLIAVDLAASVLTFGGSFGSRAFEDLVMPRFGLDILALAWPIVVLAVINTRSARQSCH
jgi:hypothetical protein